MHTKAQAQPGKKKKASAGEPTTDSNKDNLNGNPINRNDQTVFLALDLAGYSLDDILQDEMMSKWRYNGEMAINWVRGGEESR